MNIKPETVTQIETFAKSVKVNKAKLLEFCQTLLADNKTAGKTGRKASADTLQLRETIRNMRGDLPQQFTVSDVVAKTGAHPVYVNNALSYLRQNGVKLEQCGKLGGKRGKPQTIWRFAE